MENPSQLSVPGPAVIEAPAATPEAARARISQLIADKSFSARYAQNDGIAVATLRGLQELAYRGTPLPGPPATADAARERLNQLTSSPDFARKAISNPGGPEQREITMLERLATGMSPEQTSETPEQKAQRQLIPFREAPPTPADYQIDYRDERGFRVAVDSPEAQALDSRYRALAHEAGLPQMVVTALAAETAKLPNDPDAEAKCRER